MRVKPSSRENKLILNSDGSFSLKVKPQPTRGKANKEVIKWLSQSLNIPQNTITIVKGLRSREKIIDISGVELKKIIERAD